MNEQLPEVSALLSDASEEAEQVPIRSRVGVGRQYLEVLKMLKAKNFTFPQITDWFAKRGVVLSKGGWKSAWKTYVEEENGR